MPFPVDAAIAMFSKDLLERVSFPGTFMFQVMRPCNPGPHFPLMYNSTLSLSWVCGWCVVMNKVAFRPVERWLGALVTMLQDTLKAAVDAALASAALWDTTKPREAWALEPCAQAALIASQAAYAPFTPTFHLEKDNNK